MLIRQSAKHISIKPLAIAAALAAAAAFWPMAASADSASETVTAATHAGFAAKAANIKGVHTHLHHVLNCLVGPGGTGFDKTNINPCVNAGKGAIPDAADAATKTALEAAADKARAGIAATDFETAKNDAARVEEMLKATK